MEKLCACGCGKPTKRKYASHECYAKDPVRRAHHAEMIRGRKASTETRAKLSEMRTGAVFTRSRRGNISTNKIAWYDVDHDYYRIEDTGYMTGCWIWARALLKTGYGAIHRDGKNYRAHRWMYERTVGKIEAGIVLDHLCEVKACVNPDHLEPVTKRENTRRHFRSDA